MFVLAAFLAACTPAPTPVGELQPISWPLMARLPDEAIREQIMAQRNRLTELAAEPDVDPQTLGSAYVQAGLTLMAYDYLDEARPAMVAAAAFQPEDPRWPYYVAYIDLGADALAEAEAGFQQVLELLPGHIPSRMHLAEIELATERVAEARARIESILADEPENAAAHALLGDIADAAGDKPLAIAHYLLALQFQPEASRLHGKLAAIYYAAGSEDEGKAQEAQSGEVPPQLQDPWVVEFKRLNRSAIFYLDQGVRYVQSGRVEEGILHLEHAIELDPQNVRALSHLALARFSQGDQATALEIGQRAIDAAMAKHGTDAGVGALSESDAHAQMGTFLLAAGRDAEAEEMLLEAVSLDSENVRALNDLGRFLRHADRCAEANDYYRRSLEASPAQPGVIRVEAALCLVRSGQDLDARDLLAAAVQDLPDDGDVKDAYARVLAASPESRARDGASALGLAEANYEQRQGVDALETLAMAHAEVGDFSAAIAWQEKAITLAESQDRDAWRAALIDQQARYRDGEPNRSPWPDFMYSQ